MWEDKPTNPWVVPTFLAALAFPVVRFSQIYPADGESTLGSCVVVNNRQTKLEFSIPEAAHRFKNSSKSLLSPPLKEAPLLSRGGDAGANGHGGGGWCAVFVGDGSDHCDSGRGAPGVGLFARSKPP